MWRILWRIWGRLWIGFKRFSPAGRAACAAGGHFVACVPVLAGRDPGGLALLGGDVPDQREGTCALGRLDKLKRRVNARPPRRRPVRQDMPEYAWM
jgi:hypothetical protein